MGPAFRCAFISFNPPEFYYLGSTCPNTRLVHPEPDKEAFLSAICTYSITGSARHMPLRDGDGESSSTDPMNTIDN